MQLPPLAALGIRPRLATCVYTLHLFLVRTCCPSCRTSKCWTCLGPTFFCTVFGPHLPQDLLPFLPELNVLDLLGPHDWRLKQFFKDPRLRAMFTFQVGVGSWVGCVLLGWAIHAAIHAAEAALQGGGRGCGAPHLPFLHCGAGLKRDGPTCRSC